MKLSERFHAAFEFVVAYYDQVSCKPDLTHRCLKCLAPGYSRLQVLRSGDKRDPRVAQSRQVLYSLTDSAQVVDSDVCYSGNIRSNVNKNEWNFPIAKVLDERILHTERQNRDAIDASLDHPPDRRFHPFRVVY